MVRANSDRDSENRFRYVTVITRTPQQIYQGEENPLNFAVSSRDKATLDMVAAAITHKQTLLAYQPVMMASDPNRVGFYEALIRVMDETGRIIPAKEFMDVIETTELGRQIDALSLNMGLRALHENPALRLSINMSARSIGYARWMQNFKRWMAKDHTIAERLILEITESSAMDMPDIVVRFMDDLQAKGISFALDDFGAGHTALRYFKDFYFDVLKIDGQFIQGIAHDPDNQALTRAMIDIARHFDMLTVAEFVETREDMLTLIELGVDCLQGYLFSAPTTRPDWMQPEIRRA